MSIFEGKELPILIDSTMLTAFRACPVKFAYEYVLCLRPAGRQRDLVAGGAFAAALEATRLAYFVGGKDHNTAIAHGYQAFVNHWGDFPHEDVTREIKTRSAKTFNRMFQAVCSYFETYPLDSDRIKPMLRNDGKPTYEFSFAVPLVADHFPRHPSGDPFIYAGRFDAFGHVDETLVVEDDKTTGSFMGATWSDQWNVRNQFLGYCWAATQSGFPCNTAVVRGIQILKTDFRHAEAIKTYSSHMMGLFETQLARDLHRMLGCDVQQFYDYNFGDSCTSFNRPCSFMDLCTSADPDPWMAAYERVKWNPLTRTVEELASEQP